MSPSFVPADTDRTKDGDTTFRRTTLVSPTRESLSSCRPRSGVPEVYRAEVEVVRPQVRRRSKQTSTQDQTSSPPPDAQEGGTTPNRIHDEDRPNRCPAPLLVHPCAGEGKLRVVGTGVGVPVRSFDDPEQESVRRGRRRGEDPDRERTGTVGGVRIRHRRTQSEMDTPDPRSGPVHERLDWVSETKALL